MRTLLDILLKENFTVIEESKNNFQRQYAFPSADNIIKVAIGMRRSGKTYFIYQTINTLLAQGVSKEQILFLDFEDERLLPMNAKEMGKLLDAFYSLYPENHERLCYLFLDEVHAVTDWHQVARRYFQSKKVQLYLTGSSSKLLSKEIHTSLRGRSLAIEIWPYSFSEFLSMHHVEKAKKPFGQVGFDQHFQYLLNYFDVGGFPAVQTLSKHEWRDTLQNYVDTTIMRDIVERYAISNIAVLKYLVFTLLKNAATTFSIHKFYNDIKSQGYKISKDTIYNYLHYIEDAFLNFMIPVYSESVRLKQNQAKKTYAVDVGLINAVSLSTNELHGKLFENLIYLDLRRQNKKINYYYTQEGYEVDFITIDPDGNRECLQVCWDESDEKTLMREERGLMAAEKELGIKGRLITPRSYLANNGV